MDKAARRPARRRIAAPRWKRIAWRIVLAIFILVLMIAIAGFVLFLNRNAAYETLVTRLLKERGYDIALTVESVTTEQAFVKDITLSQNGKRFASVKSLEAAYDWDEVFDGKLQTLILSVVTLDIEISDTGKIISDWMPAPSGKPLILPSGGITVKDATIDVSSPYGDIDIRGDVKAMSLEALTAQITFESERLETRGYAASVSGAVSAARDGQQVNLQNAGVKLSRITGPDGPLADADLSAAGTLSLPGEGSTVRYSGRADIDARNFTGPFFDSRRSQIIFDGAAAYDVKAQAVLPSVFDIKADLTDLSLRDAGRRADLARRLTLKPVLEKTPVAGVFISDITADVEGLLRRADWNGAARVHYRKDGYTVDLTGPLRVKNPKASLTLRPSAVQSEFAYEKSGSKLALRSDIVLTGNRNLSLNGFSIRGLTDNGYLWTQVDAVRGTAMTAQSWTKDETRLAPFRAAIDYRGGARSLIGITSALDYDGPLLGNDFTGLKATGRLTLNRKPSGFDLEFKSDEILTAQTVVTPFGYTARDLTMTLIESAPLLRRRGGADAITLKARGVNSLIVSDDGKEQYTLRAQQADVSGVRDEAGERYGLDMLALAVTSETSPGPGSRLQAPMLSAKLSREKGAPFQYTIDSPSVNAKAGTATLKGVGITLEGGPGATDFTYDGGTVFLAGTNLPALPVTGKGRLDSGKLTGSAKTALPRAPQFPIYVDYVYENGTGQAELDIPKFIFSPGGVQPQDLAPALRGKVVSVEGVASAKATIGFTPGQPITSKGTISLASMDFATLVGPFEGVSSDLTFSSLYPLRTSGVQTVKMEGFDPGIPLGEGTVTFTVVKDGFDLIDARWPMGSGEISVEPTFWSTAGAVNNITVKVRDIALGDLIARLGNEDISATGQINGTLPIVIDGVYLTVEGGRVEIADGGAISVRTKQLDRAGEVNGTAKIAIDALKNFEYDELSLELNGSLNGDMKLGAVFTGSNPDVLGGADFLFRTTIEGELANIARNLASATQMQNIKRSIAQKVEAEKAKEAAR